MPESDETLETFVSAEASAAAAEFFEELEGHFEGFEPKVDNFDL